VIIESIFSLQTFEWVVTSEKCAVVAGLVAWILSVIIWITSLDYFRRRFYDLFFAIHHLYLLFSLFWIYHAIWNYHFFIIPMLLFFVDRFLRMVQSAKLVDVLSARVLESGAVELKFPLKSGNNPSRSGGYCN
jgi:DMSO/TMAO reductase YedYZ heme-binding membrane subunit